MWAFDAAADANPYVLIALAVIALVAAVIYAYKKWGWFHDLVNKSWRGISTAAQVAWRFFLKPVFDGIADAIQFVGAVSVWLWKNVFVPVWHGIADVVGTTIALIATVLIAPLIIAFNLMATTLGWLWSVVFEPIFHAMGVTAGILWSDGLQPFFKSTWDAIEWVGSKFVWLYEHAIAPAAGWIADKVKWLFDKAVRPFFVNFWDGLQYVGDKFKWLYDHVISPIAGWIADKTKWLYEKGIRPQFDAMKSAVRLVGEAFGDARDAIAKHWGDVKNITKAPVNFVIDMVYTHGIKAVWDKVAKYVGQDPLPKAPKLLEAGGTVGDGWGVARPMVTNRPTAIVGEGNPRYPEYVIPTDPKYRGRALALHQAAGSQLLESGGVLGGAWDWTKDVLGKGIDWAKTGADLMVHPSKVWGSLLKDVLSHSAAGLGTSPMGRTLAQYPVKMVGALKSKLVDAVSSLVSGGGGGIGQWIKPVNVPYGTRFGVAGPMWSSGHHTGLDFPAPIGTRVNAVADGTVTMATSGGPYGNHVMINHGGGLSSLYAHMSQILTSVGKLVHQGEQIGKVGATGNVTGPHLHLEARLNGKAVDPMPYLTTVGANAQAVGSAQRYAKSILGNYGWGADQFGPLQQLWNGESGWRWNAENASSGAYGIPQALPASKMASAGADWRTNAATQVRWGEGYIHDVYGSPANAWAKWQARSPHWYDNGGYLPPGLSLVANGTGSPEPVFTRGQWDDIRSAKSSGPTSIQADVRVFVGDREITDIVRTEVSARESLTASAIDDGRWI
jgi:murein DD-endopeptidase MepM/ murein hydrolase activator NlpD